MDILAGRFEGMCEPRAQGITPLLPNTAHSRELAKGCGIAPCPRIESLGAREFRLVDETGTGNEVGTHLE